MMVCRDLDDLIEPLAAGDLSATPDVAAHLEACPACSAALAAARRLERLLALRAVPSPPARFGATILARIREDRWRADQYFDAGFNVVIALAVVLIVAGIWLLAHVSGFGMIASESGRLFLVGLTDLIARIAPVAPLYTAAIGVLSTAAAAWWWVERGGRRL